MARQLLAAAAVLACAGAGGTASHAAQPELSGDVIALAKRCSPNVHPLTMAYIVSAESRNDRLAIGVNGGYSLPRQPANDGESAATIEWLQAHGYNFDVGYGQVNSGNFAKLGETGTALLDGCTNLRAAATVLAGCYAEAVKASGEGQAALQRTLSCYNTGSQTAGFRNGYVAKVVRVAARATVLQVPALVGDGKTASPAAPPATPPAAAQAGQGAAAPSQPEKTSSDSDGSPDVFGTPDDDAFAHADPGAFILKNRLRRHVMRVFLILQRQLEGLHRDKKIKRVSIQRLDAKQWIPLFEITGIGEDRDQTITCSLRVQSANKVRTWANLTALAEWLKERFAVEACELVLTDYQTDYLTE
ncbi:MAG: hypothetical protein E5299_01975 [Burkholderia gladioli]|nr:MAG: hypothetical protein E5299_01975 [Burkholderia gladioli]